MDMREDIALLIVAAQNDPKRHERAPDEAARLVIGYLDEIGLLGDGWLMGDKSMEDDLERARERVTDLLSKARGK